MTWPLLPKYSPRSELAMVPAEPVMRPPGAEFVCADLAEGEKRRLAVDCGIGGFENAEKPCGSRPVVRIDVEYAVLVGDLAVESDMAAAVGERRAASDAARIVEAIANLR